MIPGTVLFDDNFKFRDGTIGRKIFIVLNDGSDGIYLGVKTTSRGDRFGIKHGCQALDRYPNFHLVKGSSFLSENTWVQLDNFFEFEPSQLIQKVTSGLINRLGVLPKDLIKDLLICITHSEDLSEIQESIVQSALASFQA